MIDLHTHTNYSDGTWSLKKLLEEAEKSKIEILSITDHDTIKAYQELKSFDYEKIYSGEIINGIEFNTVYDGVSFHLLAYDFDDKEIEKWIYENYEIKTPNLKKEFDFMINSCKKNNLKIGDLEYEESKGWPIDIIYPEIKKYEENKRFFKVEEWNDIDKFYNSCITNKKFPVFVDFSIHYPTADIVAKMVRKCGGKLFIAHPFRYSLDDTIGFLNVLKDNKIIDGIEVYYSKHTDEQMCILENYCKRNNLLISGGSDCHGEKKIDRKIGIGYGNLNINKDILKNWKFV